ncbi:hypothetical protein PR048_014376, partial [Dryococelus australis]
MHWWIPSSALIYEFSGVHAKNGVVHMLSGQAYPRAVRAHLLTLQVLATLILEETAVDVPFLE